VKHVGGFKSGGRTKRGMGGVLGPLLGVVPAAALGAFDDDKSSNPLGPTAAAAGKKRGGRTHKAAGGPLAPPISNSGLLGSFNYRPGGAGVLKRGGRAVDGGTRPQGGREPRRSGGELTAEKRDRLPKSEFGLPKSHKYPMEDKSHAANAKSRASQQEHAGRISKSAEEKIDA